MELAKYKHDWALGYQDETWWSRYAQPDLHSWLENGQFLKLVEQANDPKDIEPKAIACY